VDREGLLIVIRAARAMRAEVERKAERRAEKLRLVGRRI
jgi:hypothetical protein